MYVLLQAKPPERIVSLIAAEKVTYVNVGGSVRNIDKILVICYNYNFIPFSYYPINALPKSY